MVFLYLIFGHLLADFALQPKKLIAWKWKSWTGTLCHTSIHFVVTALLFLPYLDNAQIWIGLVIIAVTHFFIDIAKIQVQKRGASIVWMFFLDQACHLSVLLIVGSWWSLPSLAASGGWQAAYGNPHLFAYLILIIVILFVVDIVQLQFLLEKNRRATLRRNWKAALVRLGVFSVIYLLATT